MTDSICATRGIPAYLHQGTRGQDEDFAGEEKLYVRYRLENPSIQTAIKFERQSCNRAKYCDGGPNDVLLNSEQGGIHQGYGVIAITVSQIRSLRAAPDDGSPNKQEQRRVFDLRLDHKPHKCNYAHSEIVAHENGHPVEKIGPPSVKKRLRDLLADLFQVELPMEGIGMRLPRG